MPETTPNKNETINPKPNTDSLEKKQLLFKKVNYIYKLFPKNEDTSTPWSSPLKDYRNIPLLEALSKLKQIENCNRDISNYNLLLDPSKPNEKMILQSLEVKKQYLSQIENQITSPSEHLEFRDVIKDFMTAGKSWENPNEKPNDKLYKDLIWAINNTKKIPENAKHIFKDLLNSNINWSGKNAQYDRSMLLIFETRLLEILNSID